MTPIKSFIGTLLIGTIALLAVMLMLSGRPIVKRGRWHQRRWHFPRHYFVQERRETKREKGAPLFAICAPTRSLSNWTSLSDTALQTILIPSVERTVYAHERRAWDIRLYLGINDDDMFWLNHHEEIAKPDWLTVHVGFYNVPENQVPFNKLTRHAFNDGAEYLIRVNDDTEFITKGWISKGVETLLGYHPPNLGVVGPECNEGNTAILTHDMVHRTHMNIFQDYYPAVFSAYWIDDWITKVYHPGRSTKRSDWLVKHHINKHGTRYRVQSQEKQFFERELDKGIQMITEWEELNTETPDFHIIVLTKDRPRSLKRLLKSIQTSDYGKDKVSVDIHIDGDDPETLRISRSWRWRHHTVTVHPESRGLRAAWLEAWPNPSGRSIILEDDVELSPAWYRWMSHAWRAYGHRTDVAGISLQRQTLIPQKPNKQREIVNGHKPFLYKLVGSIGFSPQPSRWREFLQWLETKDLDTYDAHVEGLVTSDWYKMLDKKTMWTQLFIRFCEERDLYTLYVNLPEGKTLAAHWREKGDHYNGGEGKDFDLESTVNQTFPRFPVKYGWDGVEVMTCWERYNSNIDSRHSTEFVPGKSVMMEATSVKMLCDLLKPTSRVLEWGAGGSTLFYSRFVQHWDSVEHIAGWAENVQKYLTDAVPRLPVSLHSVPVVEDFRTNGTKECPNLEPSFSACSEPGKCKNCSLFRPYVEEPTTWNKTFDVILVDGRARVPCARIAHKLLSPDGVVVIHDWERPLYKSVLSDLDLVREDTSGSRHIGVLRPKRHDLESTAVSISKSHGFVYMLFLNQAFLEMTKSFICNLRSIGGAGALSNMIFIATDSTTAAALTTFAPEVGGVFTRHSDQTTSDISYGTVEYFHLIIERLSIQHRFVQIGVNVVIVEADQIWFDDAARIDRLLQTELPRHDVVTADDNGEKLIAGGFVGVRSSPRMVTFFENFVDKYHKLLESSVRDKTRKTFIGDVGESHTMSAMLKTTDTDVDVKWLDTCHFARGQWYKSDEYRRDCPKPWLVTNNWIIGNAAKIERAKKWKHWYLEKSQDACVTITS